MKLAPRIARIKLLPFLEAWEQVLPEVEQPYRSGGFILCPSMGHNELTASCIVHHTHWKCFGCGRGGDILDLLKAVYEISFTRAVAVAEERLGYSNGKDSDLVTLVAVANAPPPAASDSQRKWSEEVSLISVAFLNQVRPFLRSCDPTIADLAWPLADYVFGSLDSAGAAEHPQTPRRKRERLNKLRAFSQGHVWGLERSVQRATGKDVLDAALHPA